MKACIEINGDKHLTFGERLRYFSNAIAGLTKSYRLNIYSGEHFSIQEIPENSKNQLTDTSTPVRFYFNLVVLEILRPLCGQKVRILDVGCGSGGNIHQFSVSGMHGHYVGVDIIKHPKWCDMEEYSTSNLLVEFHELPASKISSLGKFDVVFSSMFLEHVSDVNKVLENMALVATPGAYLIHAVPAHASFFLYLAHGYRRFSATELYVLFRNKRFEDIKIYRAGGMGSFLLHLLLITIPEKFLKKEIRSDRPSLYKRFLMAAFRLDRHFRRPTLVLILVARRAQKELLR